MKFYRSAEMLSLIRSMQCHSIFDGDVIALSDTVNELCENILACFTI